MALNIRIITPDKVVFDKSVDEVILPSSTGQVGILNNHAPLLTALDIGVMRLKVSEKWSPMVVMGGFAEVKDNQLIVLVNGAEEVSAIDKASAEKDLEVALELFNSVETPKEKIDATQELRKAKARLQALTI